MSVQEGFKKYVFISGIRKITVIAEHLYDAKKLLLNWEADAWSDPTWNWKVEIRS